ncbi:MAG: MFS transporter [Actinobacteria bacterium 13_2_20CM_2_71_6]|nr:MAG: MFS transporter [Actinobacteria bacterium 13_2_20CM_2_71_6]
MFVDLRPLRESPEYRRLWVGGLLSKAGSQMTSVAVFIQVYSLTHSSLAVGMVGLTLAVPLIAFGLLGGSLADAVDRRKLVLVTSGLLAVVSVAFAVQAVLDLRQLWLLYVLTALQSSLSAIDTPARGTFTPRLLPPERLPAAAALSLLSFHFSTIVGPLLAGVVIAAAGLQAAYVVDALTFVVGLYGVARLRAMPAQSGGTRPGPRAVLEGLRFLRHEPILGTLMLLDLNATIFGMPHALFPALAQSHFGGGARTIGLLYAAPAIGGVVGAALSGPVTRVRRQGLAVLVAVTVWGASIAGFGFTHVLWLGVLLLGVAGAGDVISVVFRSTIVQVNTPDALRGRVGGVNLVVGEGGPRLGDVEAGLVAAFTSPAVSAISGGLACLVGVAVVAVAVPAFTRYEAARPPASG